MNLYTDGNFGHHSPLGNVPNFVPPKPKSFVKNYPLKVENWGDDVLMLASKGHHNIDVFKSECFKEYDDFAKSLENTECPCEHAWYKVIPHPEYTKYYTPVTEGTRGAIPITVWWGA